MILTKTRQALARQVDELKAQVERLSADCKRAEGELDFARRLFRGELHEMLKSLRNERLQRGELVKLARNVLPEQARFFQEHEREHNEIRLRQLLNEMEQR